MGLSQTQSFALIGSMTRKKVEGWTKELPARKGMLGAVRAIREETLKALELPMPVEAKERLMRILALAPEHMPETGSKAAIYKWLTAIRALAEQPLAEMPRESWWRIDGIIAMCRYGFDCRSRDERARE